MQPVVFKSVSPQLLRARREKKHTHTLNVAVQCGGKRGRVSNR